MCVVDGSLTSCSARLPVYTLVVGALFPATLVGWSLPMLLQPRVVAGGPVRPSNTTNTASGGGGAAPAAS